MRQELQGAAAEFAQSIEILLAIPQGMNRSARIKV